MEKKKVMFNSLAREWEFIISSQPVQPAQKYIYLGQLLTGDTDHEKKTYRIKMGYREAFVLQWTQI